MSVQRRLHLPHRSVIFIAFAVAFSLLGDQALYAVLPIHFMALGLFPYQVGILLSVNRWIRLITNHIAERITTRVSARWVMPLVLMISAVLTVIYSQGHSFRAILGARLLWGLCWSFLRQIGIMTSVGSTTEKDVGKAVGYYTGISRIGSIVGSFIGALLYDITGYTSTFVILGIVTFLGAPLGYASQKDIQAPKSVSRSQREIGNSKSSEILVFYGFVVGCVSSGLIMSTLGFILKNQYGNSISTETVLIGVATINGFLLASQHIIGILGAPFFGVFADWIGYRKGAFFCFMASTITLSAAMSIKWVVPFLSMILLFFISAGFAIVLLSAEAATTGSRQYASFATALDLGAAVGPIVGWTIFEFISIPILSFAVGGCLYAVATLFSIWQLKSFFQCR